MTIQRTNTNARMSQSVAHNGVVYLAGQVGSDFSVDVAEQTQATLDKIDAALADAGSSREHLLSAVIYLRDIDNDFAAMNEVWDAWVPDGHAPARACVEAHMARSAILVEISITAAVVD